MAFLLKPAGLDSLDKLPSVRPFFIKYRLLSKMQPCQKSLKNPHEDFTIMSNLHLMARLPVCAALLSICCAVGCAQRTADPTPAPAATPDITSSPVNEPAAPAQAAKPTVVPAPDKPWVTQPVKADANPQAASVAKALRTKNNPERLSMMIQPKPFSAEAYAKDPSGYLDVIEPGRCFQTAQPGPDVPQLVPVGATAATIQPNESVKLSVQTQPSQPVSFTSTDLGSFQNSLNAITVAADDQGVATAIFTATPGVSHIVRIIAGSPVVSGQVNFQVDVQIQGLVPVQPAAAPTPPAQP